MGVCVWGVEVEVGALHVNPVGPWVKGHVHEPHWREGESEYSRTCIIRQPLGNENQRWISRLLDYRGQFAWQKLSCSVPENLGQFIGECWRI